MTTPRQKSRETGGSSASPWINAVPYPTAMPEILRLHFEEFRSLWSIRQGVVFAPDWDLQDLATLEARAEAHLAGLCIGGGAAVDVARPFLGADQPGAATAATRVLMAMDSPPLEEEVLLALERGTPEARSGIGIGLRHSNIDRIKDPLGRLAASGDPMLVATILSVMAYHRLPPPVRIADLLGGPDSVVWQLLVDAVGRFGGPWGIDYLQGALDHEASALRWSALRTSARLGTLFLQTACRKAATRVTNPSSEALVFLGVVGDPDDLSLFEGMLDRKGMTRAALMAMGCLGRTTAIPTLIEAMKEPPLAYAAGRAFVRITGADDINWGTPIPPPDDLTDQEREDWNPGPSPDPDRARAWWLKEKGRFANDGRWQNGVNVLLAPLGERFNTLPLEIRRDVYLSERARRGDSVPDLELEQLASVQLSMR